MAYVWLTGKAGSYRADTIASVDAALLLLRARLREPQIAANVARCWADIDTLLERRLMLAAAQALSP